MEEKELYTKKLYWHDTYLFETTSKVIEVGHDEKKGHWVKLSETIFHPQGGGQPNDIGTINGVKIKSVEESRDLPEGIDYDLGIMIHYLEQNPELNAGDEAKIVIDKETRLRNSALHTAGHIIAGLMRTQHQYKSQTGANHFPEAARVEFKKDGENFTKETMAGGVITVIKEAREISEKYEEVPEAHRHPGRGNLARCVTIADLWKEPCSGTHVKKTSEIVDFSIRKQSESKGKITVSYSARYGLFSAADNVATDVLNAKSQPPKKKEDQYKKNIDLPEGGKVLFFLSKGQMQAIILKRGGGKETIDPSNIYININNSPDNSVQLSSKELSWQKLALDRVEEITLAFAKNIVITQLSDWSFDAEQKSAATLQV